MVHQFLRKIFISRHRVTPERVQCMSARTRNRSWQKAKSQNSKAKGKCIPLGTIFDTSESIGYVIVPYPGDWSTRPLRTKISRSMLSDPCRCFVFLSPCFIPLKKNGWNLEIIQLKRKIVFFSIHVCHNFGFNMFVFSGVFFFAQPLIDDNFPHRLRVSSLEEKHATERGRQGVTGCDGCDISSSQGATKHVS